MIELPITVASALRLPVTGASLLLMPAAMRYVLASSLSRRATLVINLHAMDLVEPIQDGLPAGLQARQPELRQPLEMRLTALRSWLARVGRDRTVCTCAQAANTPL